MRTIDPGTTYVPPPEPMPPPWEQPAYEGGNYYQGEKKPKPAFADWFQSVLGQPLLPEAPAFTPPSQSPVPWSGSTTGQGSMPWGEQATASENKPKEKQPIIYNFAGGEAAPGGANNMFNLPGMPTFLQNPNMPPVPTLPPPDQADTASGTTWWGGSSGGRRGGGGGGGGFSRSAWAKALYSLNVNR
jgi:hypothetical protein